jgi:rSAM/selenodomain-associated transferase 1
MTARAVHALVVAKAPVPGQVKTRLGAHVGDEAAAEVAAAALLDTIAACAAAFGRHCHLALAGDLVEGVHADEIGAALASWHVFPQEGGPLGERLAHAHRIVSDGGNASVVQVGMDTPQLTPSLLTEAADRLRPGVGVIGPAHDGGWWLLGLSCPGAAEVLAGVPMSTGRTGFDTRRALTGWGVRIATTRTLRDVDTVQDAELVARAAPGTRFARSWAGVGSVVGSAAGSRVGR